jgi:hypothetical protein
MSRAWHKLPENERKRTRGFRAENRRERRGRNKVTRGLGPAGIIGYPMRGTK